MVGSSEPPPYRGHGVSLISTRNTSCACLTAPILFLPGGSSLLLCGAALPVSLTAHCPDLVGEVILWDFRFGASESRFSRQNFHVTMFGSCEWPYFLSFGPNLCTARGKIGADLQQEAKHEAWEGADFAVTHAQLCHLPPPSSTTGLHEMLQDPPYKTPLLKKRA